MEMLKINEVNYKTPLSATSLDLHISKQKKSDQLKVNKIISFLLLIIAFTMNPIVVFYAFNYNYMLNFVVLLTIWVLFITHQILTKTNFCINKVYMALIFYFMFLIIVSLFKYGINKEISFFMFWIPLFIIVNFSQRLNAKQFIKKSIIVINFFCILNFILFVYVNIFNGPLNPIFLHNSGQLRYHAFFLGFGSNHKIQFFGFPIARTFSYFQEPSQFATILILMIPIIVFYSYRKTFYLTIFSGLLSLSGMFYAYFLVLMIVKFFKKIPAFLMIPAIFLSQVLISYYLQILMGGTEFSQVLFDYGSNDVLNKEGSFFVRILEHYKSATILFSHPLGLGMVENHEMINIRTFSGLVPAACNIGGIPLLFFLFYFIIRIEQKINKLNETFKVYAKSTLIIITTFSAYGIFTPLFAILITLFIKELNKYSEKSKVKNKTFARSRHYT